MESDFGQDGSVEKTFPVARGVIHCEARLGVNPEPSDPSGSLAEPNEYCVFEVGVTFSQGQRQSTVWVSSGAYPRDPVQ